MFNIYATWCIIVPIKSDGPTAAVGLIVIVTSLNSLWYEICRDVLLPMASENNLYIFHMCFSFDNERELSQQYCLS